MGRGWVHTVHREEIWINEIEEEGEISRHRTKEEAVSAGREAARARHTEQCDPSPRRHHRRTPQLWERPLPPTWLMDLMACRND